jgi:hypothetical protein
MTQRQGIGKSKNTERDRQTDRQEEKERKRERHTLIEGDKDSQRKTDTEGKTEKGEREFVRVCEREKYRKIGTKRQQNRKREM